MAGLGMEGEICMALYVCFKILLILKSIGIGTSQNNKFCEIARLWKEQNPRPMMNNMKINIQNKFPTI